MAEIDPRFLEQLEKLATVSDTVSAALGSLGKSEYALEIKHKRLTAQLQRELGLKDEEAKLMADGIKAELKRQEEEDKILDRKKKREEAIANGFKGLAGALGDLAKSTIANNSAIYNSDKAFSAAAPVLSTLGAAIKGITQAFASMAAGIPFVGGIFAGAQQILGAAVDMAIAVKQQQLENAQKYIDTYQTLSKAGVTFGGDIEAMSKAASRGGMAIDQYAKFITTSVEDLAKAGGTLQQAANRVMTMSQSALSGQNAKLLTIYGTYDNLNSALAIYQGTMASMGFDTVKNQDLLNKSSASYLYSLKELQALTGLSADQYKKEAEERAKYAAYQIKLNSMAPEVASRLDQQVSIIGKLYGKQAQDLAVESIARNGRLISQSALEFKAFNGPIADVVQQLINVGSNAALDDNQMRVERQRIVESMEPAIQEQIKRNSTLAGLVFGTNDKVITNVNQSLSEVIKANDKRKNIDKAQAEITTEQTKIETAGSKSYRTALDSLTLFKKEMDEITRNSLPGLGGTVKKLLTIQKTLYDTFSGPRWDAAVDYFIQKIYDMANALGSGTPGGAERGMSASEVGSQRSLSTSPKFKKQLSRPSDSAEGVVPDNLAEVPDSVARMFAGGRKKILNPKNAQTGGKISQTAIEMMQMIQDAFPGAQVTSGTGGHTTGGHVLGRAFDWALPPNSEFLQTWADFQDPNSPIDWKGQPPNAQGAWIKRPSKSYADFVTEWMKQRGMTKSLNEYNNPSSGATGPHFHAEFDKGGDIPAGSKGIVGERGYELVDGPARVTSTNQTTAMFKDMSTTFTKMLSVMSDQRDTLDKIANHTA